ncbi:hypothetical protein AB0M36_25145 [Actinoplanes sp. NPDC051346]|uniref:hypothetical protein n=1 Tax=Actinoplanes sp. NPDC051346 TaxID=3155048 RepID=UPI00341A7FA9
MENPPDIGSLTLSHDVHPGDWIVDGVQPFSAQTVCSLIPQGFEAFGRIFHPAYRLLGAQKEEVRWTVVALANQRQPHPAMEWASITGAWRFLTQDSQPGLWDQAPSQGSMPLRQAARLADVLTEQTRGPQDCWFAVWEGWGALAVSPDELPKVELPGRRMLLFSGSLSAATTSLAANPWDQRANLWWPEDRTWCVATDVNLLTTYIGGSQDCIDALVADSDLETMRISRDQRITWDSDKINPLPSGHPDPRPRWETA